jgi:hypothetical protein
VREGIVLAVPCKGDSLIRDGKSSIYFRLLFQSPAIHLTQIKPDVPTREIIDADPVFDGDGLFPSTAMALQCDQDAGGIARPGEDFHVTMIKDFLGWEAVLPEGQPLRFAVYIGVLLFGEFHALLAAKKP